MSQVIQKFDPFAQTSAPLKKLDAIEALMVGNPDETHNQAARQKRDEFRKAVSSEYFTKLSKEKSQLTSLL